MAWEGYVDSSLISRGLASAAIFGHDGNLWAASQSFSYKSEEIKVILQGFEDPTAISGKGALSLGGTRYLILTSDDAAVMGKAGTKGVCIRKTTETLIIGICDKPMDLAECSRIVGNFADYLISQNY